MAPTSSDFWYGISTQQRCRAYDGKETAVSDYPKAVALGWHPIATSAQLKLKPLSRRLLGEPLVAFRSSASVAVLVDRCPHRNVALSEGRVRDGDLECRYHGWRFNGVGICTLTPGASHPARVRSQCLSSVERDGVIWASLAKEPPPFPVLPNPIGEDGFDSFWWAVKPSQASFIDAMENFLDPAHPHFLHEGIVRSGRVRNPVEVTISVRKRLRRGDLRRERPPIGSHSATAGRVAVD